MTCARYLFAALLFAAGGAAQADDDVAQVRCKDGTLSKAGRGACSGHGGVAKNEGAPVPTKKTPATLAADEDKKIAPTTEALGSPAQVRCKDGTLAEAGQGACGRHGGIDKASGAAPRAVPGATPAPPAEKQRHAPNPKSELTTKPPVAPDGSKATARCQDGTYSRSSHHSGTCSGHGGVAEWLDGSQR